MSKALKFINQDTAYALGEEAFRAGCEAMIELLPNRNAHFNATKAIEEAWNNFEPSEDVKDLING